MQNKYKVAITVGCFDMLHQGHVNLFKKMQDIAENIIVLVHDDRSIYENKGRFPVQGGEQRVVNVLRLAGLEGIPIHGVERVSSKDPSFKLELIIENMPFEKERAIYVRGADWVEFPGMKKLEELGIPIRFVPYTEGVSSSKRRGNASNL